MTDAELRQRFDAIAGALLAIADDLRNVKAETTGTSKALHDIKNHVAVIAANTEMTAEQLRPLGTAIGELEQRMAHVEQHARVNNGGT